MNACCLTFGDNSPISSVTVVQLLSLDQKWPHSIDLQGKFKNSFIRNYSYRGRYRWEDDSFSQFSRLCLHLYIHRTLRSSHVMIIYDCLGLRQSTVRLYMLTHSYRLVLINWTSKRELRQTLKENTLFDTAMCWPVVPWKMCLFLHYLFIPVAKWISRTST